MRFPETLSSPHRTPLEAILSPGRMTSSPHSTCSFSCWIETAYPGCTCAITNTLSVKSWVNASRYHFRRSLRVSSRTVRFIYIEYLFRTFEKHLPVCEEPGIWGGPRLWLHNIPIQRDTLYTQVEAIPVRLAEEPALYLEHNEQAEHEHGLNQETCSWRRKRQLSYVESWQDPEFGEFNLGNPTAPPEHWPSTITLSPKPHRLNNYVAEVAAWPE